MVSIIACVSKNLGIGICNKLPWHIPADLKFFKKVTSGHSIIMGRKTFDSIGGKPLPNRENIVLSKDHFSFDEVIDTIKNNKDTKKYFVIGGSQVYKLFLPYADNLYLTKIISSPKGTPGVKCDTFFPQFNGNDFSLKSVSPVQHDAGYSFEFLHYTRNTNNTSDENAYLNLCKDILKNNYGKVVDRTKVGTYPVFGRQLRFNLRNSIPCLTTRQVAWKSCIKELLWFLRGDTDAKILQKDGVKIWDGNSTRSFLDNRGLYNYPDGVLGPVYGFNWRNFGAKYDPIYADSKVKKPTDGFDQLEYVVNLLKEDPFSRRIYLTAWNPAALNEMALPPCHLSIQFNVKEENGKKYLSGHVYQRSCDVFLGFPFNIFSYSVMINIIAKKVGMLPDELIFSLGDVHIYSNHINQVMEQIKRDPFPFPKLEMSEDIATKDFSEMNITDFKLRGYFHHDIIKAEMAI